MKRGRGLSRFSRLPCKRFAHGDARWPDRAVVLQQRLAVRSRSMSLRIPVVVGLLRPRGLRISGGAKNYGRPVQGQAA